MSFADEIEQLAERADRNIRIAQDAMAAHSRDGMKLALAVALVSEVRALRLAVMEATAPGYPHVSASEADTTVRPGAALRADWERKDEERA